MLKQFNFIRFVDIPMYRLILSIAIYCLVVMAKRSKEWQISNDQNQDYNDVLGRDIQLAAGELNPQQLNKETQQKTELTKDMLTTLQIEKEAAELKNKQHIFITSNKRNKSIKNEKDVSINYSTIKRIIKGGMEEKEYNVSLLLNKTELSSNNHNIIVNKQNTSFNDINKFQLLTDNNKTTSTYKTIEQNLLNTTKDTSTSSDDLLILDSAESQSESTKQDYISNTLKMTEEQHYLIYDWVECLNDVTKAVIFTFVITLGTFSIYVTMHWLNNLYK